MKCFYYYFFNPVPDSVEDNNSNLALRIDIKNTPLELAVITFDDASPKAIRFEIKGLKNEKIPTDILEKIESLKEHYLSVMQLTFDPSIRYFHRPIWNFVDDNSGPSLNCSLRFEGAPDYSNQQQVFLATYNKRSLLQLLANGNDNAIPLPFRYLSLYKILEHKFKKKGKWKKEQFKEFLNSFAEKWMQLDFQKSIQKHIHCLRDRCAHAKTNSDQIGISTLSRESSVEVEKAISVLVDMGKVIVGSECDGIKIR
ncbi:MAG: methylamine utilization protein MauJ [Oligoflexales bacterium]